MSENNKVHLNYVIVVGSEHEAEGDRIFASHIEWMKKTHHREGEKALLNYCVSKAPELSNPMDPSSSKTGNMIFVLDETYASEAGVADHFEQAQTSWQDFGALGEWLGKNKIVGFPVGKIINKLW